MAKERVDIGTVWGACVQVMQEDPRPLETGRVARACGWNEEELVSALISYTGPNQVCISFRYPATYRAAITGMAANDGSYAVGAFKSQQ